MKIRSAAIYAGGAGSGCNPDAARKEGKKCGRPETATPMTLSKKSIPKESVVKKFTPYAKQMGSELRDMLWIATKTAATGTLAQRIGGKIDEKLDERKKRLPSKLKPFAQKVGIEVAQVVWGATKNAATNTLAAYMEKFGRQKFLKEKRPEWEMLKNEPFNIVFEAAHNTATRALEEQMEKIRLRITDKFRHKPSFRDRIFHSFRERIRDSAPEMLQNAALFAATRAWSAWKSRNGQDEQDGPPQEPRVKIYQS